MNEQAVVLFDGVCNLCNGAVRFIIKRDPTEAFLFASQQGEAGQKLLECYGIDTAMRSFVLVENGRAYRRSDAALRVCRHLAGGYRYLYWLRVIPRPVRDVVYDFVAKNRYRWFGKSESCMVPSPTFRKRFLD